MYDHRIRLVPKIGGGAEVRVPLAVAERIGMAGVTDYLVRHNIAPSQVGEPKQRRDDWVIPIYPEGQ